MMRLIRRKLRNLAAAAAIASTVACGNGDAGSPGSNGGTGGTSAGGNGAGGTAAGGGAAVGGGGTAPGVSSECGSVRLTQYTADDRGWCGFDRSHAALPDFVRAGMTVAIAEPYNGSSYQGDPGEACGECWELDTMASTQLVMVHDLCPIQGNPVCAGSHFHFDLSSETAAAVHGGGSLGEAALRRVPCPVTGAIQARISDRNPYGYLKIAFFNQRFPIRTAEYRPVGSDSWLPMARCLARWCVDGDKSTFAESGPGAVFRLTSAKGDKAEGAAVLSYATGADSVFDTGAQFAPEAPPAGVCEFKPPGDVYDEGWGGIDGVRWEINPWGNSTAAEIKEGCAESSASCVLLGSFAGGGAHITYRTYFPTATFAHLALQLRTQSGSGTVEVAPRSEAGRCDPTTVEVDSQWKSVDIDVAARCTMYNELQGLTISKSSAAMDLVVDEIFFK